MIGKNYHLAIAAQILKQAVRSWNDNNPDMSNDMLKQLVDYLNKHLIEQDVTKTINGKDVVLRGGDIQGRTREELPPNGHLVQTAFEPLGEIVFNGIRYAPVKPCTKYNVEFYHTFSHDKVRELLCKAFDLCEAGSDITDIVKSLETPLHCENVIARLEKWVEENKGGTGKYF